MWYFYKWQQCAKYFHALKTEMFFPSYNISIAWNFNPDLIFIFSTCAVALQSVTAIKYYSTPNFQFSYCGVQFPLPGIQKHYCISLHPVPWKKYCISCSTIHYYAMRHTLLGKKIFDKTLPGSLYHIFYLVQ